MIIYEAKEWVGALRHFHTSFSIRVLLRRVGYVSLYGILLTLVDQHVADIHIPFDGTLFSLLGITLSLLLVFRTNTAYDRFWEGRRQWGALVNYSRNLAVLLDALLPDDATTNRIFFARCLSNFALALKGHLRAGVDFAELEEMGDDDVQPLHQYAHIPSRISALFLRRLQVLRQDNLVNDADLITLRLYHQALLDITGACERIRKTPIPFSYSFFIKLFITVYVLLIPFVLVQTYGYFAIVATVLAAYALIGIEMIGDEIEEPFGLDCNDLPLNQIAQTIRRNVHEILAVTPSAIHLPKPETEYVKVN
ncbi:bestrophin family protein [Spirosoma koreense]